jgi:hypothetical protein
MPEIQEHMPEGGTPPLRSFEKELTDWQKLQERVEPGTFVLVTADGTRKFGSKAELLRILREEGPEERVQ